MPAAPAAIPRRAAAPRRPHTRVSKTPRSRLHAPAPPGRAARSAATVQLSSWVSDSIRRTARELRNHPDMSLSGSEPKACSFGMRASRVSVFPRQLSRVEACASRAMDRCDNPCIRRSGRRATRGRWKRLVLRAPRAPLPDNRIACLARPHRRDRTTSWQSRNPNQSAALRLPRREHQRYWFCTTDG